MLRDVREDRIRDRSSVLATPVPDVIEGVTKLP